ncbi:MAG: hypothetical protein CMK74_20180 [Pseudomonadales bacterium]|nr:hypothetical protein [Pseudomonadales bacterium]|tara:strand:+ start:1241 stop:1546 length:306 start_codon:yes stop_codon:yes gene_type:complete
MIFAIIGGTASGKTTLSEAIHDLSPSKVIVLDDVSTARIPQFVRPVRNYLMSGYIVIINFQTEGRVSLAPVEQFEEQLRHAGWNGRICRMISFRTTITKLA